jgi:alpha-tubulin suppressor-like RCC1 family protein
MRRACCLGVVLSAVACTDWNALDCDAGGTACQLGAGGGGGGAGGGAMPRLQAARAWALGDAFSCFTRGGRVECWGDNLFGQTGKGSTDAGPVAPTYVAGLTDVFAITAGSSHACAIERDGGLWCWGNNTAGPVDPKDATAPPSPAVAARHVDVMGEAVIDVAAGLDFTCAVTQAGAVYCWGDDTHGQVGAGAWANGSGPNRVNLPDAGRVCAGDGHACAVGTDGTVWCWGDNRYAQLGNDGGDTFVPRVVTNLGPSYDVACGASHGCALGTDLSLWCWGGDGVRGDGSGMASEGQPYAEPTVSPGGTPVAIVARKNTTCALLASGLASCWGDNGYFQLQATSAGNINEPHPIGEVGAPIGSLGVGGQHTCAEVDGAGVFCWGNNDAGQLGTTAGPSPSPSARLVPLP